MIVFDRNRPLGCVLAFAVVALTACTGSDPAASDSEAAASLTVRLTSPQRERWPRELSADGALRAWQEMVIGAEIGPYRVASLQADVGTWAAKGQVLATLAQDTLLADRARLQASVAEAQANLSKANSDVARADQLKDSGALSAQQIESYRVSKLTAQASLASAQAQLRGVQVQLGQTYVRAPDAGVVSSRAANLGNVISAGTELFRMVRQGRVEWQAELTSRQLGQLREGQTARVKLPDGQVVTGSVRLISPTLSGDTSRGIAYVQLPPRSAAQAGMYGSGVIEVGDAEVMTLPESAVVLRDGKSWVFLLGKGNKVAETEVVAGQRRNSRIEVSGLPANARVVATGASFLNDGATVRVERDAGK